MNKGKSIVSVIVPAYNVEAYIEKCVFSIINQTYNNLEIIIVDDGSTDKTFEICKKIASSDDRIKFVSQKNSGQSAARNKGLELATGEYIGFVDADDWIETHFFEKLVKVAEENELDMCVCNRRVFTEENELLYEMNSVKRSIYTIKDINRYFYEHFFQYTPVVYNRIYKKKIWNDIKFLDLKEIGTEDTLANFEIMFRLKRVGEVDDTFYNNLERRGSTARTYNGGMLRQNLSLYQKCVEKIQNERELQKRELETMCLYIYNFFQQRAWKYIKKYAFNGYEEILKNELLEIKNFDGFRKISWDMVLNNQLSLRLKEAGYRTRGVVLIKLLYCLQGFGFFNLEKKFIEKIFMK